MDYEEKYKTALERAKEIYTGSYKPEVALTIAETFIKVFPELKESKVEPPSFDEAQGTPIIKKCKEQIN